MDEKGKYESPLLDEYNERDNTELRPMSVQYTALDSVQDSDNKVLLTGEKKSTWQRFKSKVSMVHLILLGVVFGVGIGLITAVTKPPQIAVSWIELPGDLFLRSLQCLVVPLIFSNMVVGMGSITGMGEDEEEKNDSKDSDVNLLDVENTQKKEEVNPDVQSEEVIDMDEDYPSVIAVNRSMSIWTAGRQAADAMSFEDDDETEEKIATAPQKEDGSKRKKNLAGKISRYAFLFYTATTILASLSGLLWVAIFKPYFTSIETKAEIEELGERPQKTRDISTSIQDLFKTLVPDNIISSAAQSDILALISFAMFLGVMISKLPVGKGQRNLVYDFFVQLNDVFLSCIQVIIKISPIGVMFLIAGTLASNPDFAGTLADLGLLVACVEIGHLAHVLITYPLIYVLFVRKNPFTHLKNMIQAVMTALGTSSSAATLPVTMKCTEEKCGVRPLVSRFVLPLGATINMDGTALYLPAAIIWMSVIRQAPIDPGSIAMLVVVSTVGSMGASPIPNAGLVLIIMVWDSSFPGISIPSQVAYLLAVDWLLDRSQTCVNIVGDSVAAAVVNKHLKIN